MLTEKTIDIPSIYLPPKENYRARVERDFELLKSLRDGNELSPVYRVTDADPYGLSLEELYKVIETKASFRAFGDFLVRQFDGDNPTDVLDIGVGGGYSIIAMFDEYYARGQYLRLTGIDNGTSPEYLNPKREWRPKSSVLDTLKAYDISLYPQLTKNSATLLNGDVRMFSKFAIENYRQVNEVLICDPATEGFGPKGIRSQQYSMRKFMEEVAKVLKFSGRLLIIGTGMTKLEETLIAVAEKRSDQFIDIFNRPLVIQSPSLYAVPSQKTSPLFAHALRAIEKEVEEGEARLVEARITDSANYMEQSLWPSEARRMKEFFDEIRRSDLDTQVAFNDFRAMLKTKVIKPKGYSNLIIAERKSQN
ncbi:class I SAM-dependent methyltransferase [Candidatus Gottesmanbacteria bacterium]|nr:class I SAM-dependent methyltransferase [Candidatus Gottesmanbacteria bacterium]